MDKENNNFPFEVQDVEPEINAAMKENFEDSPEDGFVRIGPKGYFLPKFYLEYGPKLYNMESRPDQVFVTGFPRSGTTWTELIVWLILHDLNYEECEKTTILQKWKHLEFQAVLHEKAVISHIERHKLSEDNIKFLMRHTDPIDKVMNSNFIKSHLPLSLLSPKILETSKMVYIARDPRDVVVSVYHYCRGGFWPFKKDFKTMWNGFYKGSMYYCPYFEHVKEFWEMRNHPNLLFIFYEDIRNDRMKTLRRIADFFNKSFSDDQLLEACGYLDFSVLKDKESFNQNDCIRHQIMKPDAKPFLRKGVVGGWREYFDSAMQREAEQWIAANLRDTDLRFPSMKA